MSVLETRSLNLNLFISSAEPLVIFCTCDATVIFFSALWLNVLAICQHMVKKVKFCNRLLCTVPSHTLTCMSAQNSNAEAKQSWGWRIIERLMVRENASVCVEKLDGWKGDRAGNRQKRLLHQMTMVYCWNFGHLNNMRKDNTCLCKVRKWLNVRIIIW